MGTVYKVLTHTLELVVIIGIAYLITTLFNLDNEGNRFIITIVMAAFVKFARTSPKVPLKDYINE